VTGSRTGLRFKLLIALLATTLLQFSGYRLFYAGYAFDEYVAPGTGSNPVVARHAYTCHYFSGLGLHYSVVGADRKNWCRWACRPATVAWRKIFEPSYVIASRPICRD